MEVSALKHHGLASLRGPTPLLRLQADERLIVLTRRGNEHAFEALVARYEARLLAFCRHMLGSREDAEDVLQEVFAAAYNAVLADDRPINVRPWLYRIARNRALNHLRRHQAVGVDSMDVHLSEHGATTADQVHRREEFRELLDDMAELAESQRTALLLREMEALSYEQIAEAMETTVPSVKSLLVRARVALAEAAEARKLTCDEVRLELGEVAEGLKRSSPPVRRHLRTCERCKAFRKELKDTNRALTALYPVGPLLLVKKLVLAKLGTTASAGGAAAGGGSVGAGGVSAGLGAVATKTAAGLAAAALVTAGAVEVDHVTSGPGSRTRTHHGESPSSTPPQASAPASRVGHAPPLTVSGSAGAQAVAAPVQGRAARPARDEGRAAAATPVTPTRTTTTATTPTTTTPTTTAPTASAATTTTPTTPTTTTTSTTATSPPPTVQEDSGTSVLPSEGEQGSPGGGSSGAGSSTGGSAGGAGEPSPSHRPQGAPAHGGSSAGASPGQGSAGASHGQGSAGASHGAHGG